MQYIDASDAKAALSSTAEVALLDVREYGQFGEGHPFFATNLPYSTLEVKALRLLPCLHSHCILMDDNDGVAEKAHTQLSSMGYQHVSIVREGVDGWDRASYTLYKGVNLPSKSYGEILEHQAGTPSVTATELASMLSSNKPPLLLDGRTPAEFSKMNIPGAQSVPNAEIGHRLSALLDNDNRTIVVNCAGRTRSILGAQTLRQLGVKNPVFALENGTAGWSLAGLTLSNGSPATALPAMSNTQYELSVRRGAEYRNRYSIPGINLQELEKLQADDMRCLYLLDVRSREEYLTGHLAGSIHAPGGQLVQATDQWVAVRGARLVLVDDSGLRASTTAHWLRSMGHDAQVLDEDVSKLTDTLSGIDTDTTPLTAGIVATETIALQSLHKFCKQGAELVDVSPSMTYRSNHIAGSRWGIRPRLSELATQAGWNKSQKIILCGADKSVRQLAAQEFHTHGFTELAQIDGDMNDWQKADLETQTTPELPADDDCIDYLFFVHDRHDGNLLAARQYLEWETGLLKQLDDQERGVFVPWSDALESDQFQTSG